MMTARWIPLSLFAAAIAVGAHLLWERLVPSSGRGPILTLLGFLSIASYCAGWLWARTSTSAIAGEEPPRLGLGSAVFLCLFCPGAWVSLVLFTLPDLWPYAQPIGEGVLVLPILFAPFSASASLAGGARGMWRSYMPTAVLSMGMSTMLGLLGLLDVLARSAHTVRALVFLVWPLATMVAVFGGAWHVLRRNAGGNLRP
jgi:hypothetical protein